MSEWIRISERFPEFAGRYLVFTSKNQNVFIAYYLDVWKCFNLEGDGEMGEEDDVFAWMNLPEFPEKKKNVQENSLEDKLLIRVDCLDKKVSQVQNQLDLIKSEVEKRLSDSANGLKSYYAMLQKLKGNLRWLDKELSNKFIEWNRLFDWEENL